ncbi:DNA ligase [Helicobacter zhangjianzhongii]|uniref:DNA ligase n=1 Tax=Helicobacter zhangjianzhongii TaxID=2974574 RepID=A0ACC6FU99_9HELI|nr:MULTISPECIES: DNA ligase [unclassified Helicobacter]MDL0080760.1 DNA ligase [Helicobacter sp. CPD2-1]MDL0082715.1 DNA ligase [Helicobacter sp. XJK30-2]
MTSLRYRIHFLLLLCGLLAYAKDLPQIKQAQSKKPPQVLLLMDYHKAKPNNLQEYVMSEKLDGVRALWNGKQLITRNGRVINAPTCFTKDFPPFMLDGELWIGRGEFEKILALVQKDCTHCPCHSPSTDKHQSLWDKVGYYVFDVPDCGLESSQKAPKPCTLFERLSVLESYLSGKAGKATRITPIKHQPITSEKELFAHLRDLSKQGAEGLVLRKINAPYEQTRSTNALKLKLYEDTECKVIAHHKGKGKYASKLGSLTCEQEITANGAKRTLRFKIGSGFSDKERDDPPPIGSIITYKFYGYTKNGVPRFATFHRIYHNP